MLQLERAQFEPPKTPGSQNLGVFGILQTLSGVKGTATSRPWALTPLPTPELPQIQEILYPHADLNRTDRSKLGTLQGSQRAR